MRPSENRVLTEPELQRGSWALAAGSAHLVTTEANGSDSATFTPTE